MHGNPLRNKKGKLIKEGACPDKDGDIRDKDGSLLASKDGDI